MKDDTSESIGCLFIIIFFVILIVGVIATSCEERKEVDGYVRGIKLKAVILTDPKTEPGTQIVFEFRPTGGLSHVGDSSSGYFIKIGLQHGWKVVSNAERGHGYGTLVLEKNKSD